MFKEYKILENIIRIDQQDIIEKYVKEEKVKWENIDDITGPFGDPLSKRKFPARVIKNENIHQNILKIVNEIEINVCNILGVEYVKTYRSKINHTNPLNFDYDPTDLIHIDMKMDHIAVVYYINDSDGDTVILNNLNGNSMDEMFKHLNGVKKENFIPMVSVKPKKGSVTVFYGNLYHYGDYPKLTDRYVINIDLAIKNKISNSLI